VVAYAPKGLSITEFAEIPLPEGHPYQKIFRLGDTIGLYAPDVNEAVWLDGARRWLPFQTPENVCLIQWPAMVTPDAIWICSLDTTNYSEITTENYNRIPAITNSCCWLARTLFAVEDRRIIAVGAKSTKKRVLDILPNTMCAITAAFPSELIFVTTLPELKVITIKQPFIQTVALMDIRDNDLEAFRYMLYYMPTLPVDPAAVSSLSPMFAMSVFNKSPPKFVTGDVIRIYSRFARFMELQHLVKQTRGDPDILRKVADAARRIGQFEIARQLYDEINDYDSLFALFVTARHQRNLGVLSFRSPIGSAIQGFFGIAAHSAPYEALPNLQLPRISAPHTGLEFTLYAGDPSETTPLYPPVFDELSDFGIGEHPLPSDEAEQVAAAEAEQAHPADADQPPVEIEYRERPKEAEVSEADKPSGLANFFDDEEEPKPKALQIEIKPVGNPAAGGLARRRGMTVTGKRANPFSLAPDAAGAATTEGVTTPRQNDDAARVFSSSLFMDTS
jgi:hypothetical protein